MNVPGNLYFSYRGYNVFYEHDDYGQGKVKTLHFACLPSSTERIEIDISPYGLGDHRLIKRIIDMGFPKRPGRSPITHADLDTLLTTLEAAE